MSEEWEWTPRLSSSRLKEGGREGARREHRRWAKSQVTATKKRRPHNTTLCSGISSLLASLLSSPPYRGSHQGLPHEALYIFTCGGAVRSISHFDSEPVWGHGASVNRRGERLLNNHFGGMGPVLLEGSTFLGAWGQSKCKGGIMTGGKTNHFLIILSLTYSIEVVPS